MLESPEFSLSFVAYLDSNFLVDACLLLFDLLFEHP